MLAESWQMRCYHPHVHTHTQIFLFFFFYSRCVDPLDGTKEFIKRNGDFTVNIGLCVKGAPFAGVVYCPALDPPVIYKGVKDDGLPIKEECDAVGGAAGYDSFKTIRPKVRSGILGLLFFILVLLFHSLFPLSLSLSFHHLSIVLTPNCVSGHNSALLELHLLPH